MSNTLLFSRARLSSPPPRHSFVLASTQDLHEKINQLANRVRDLEDALRASHTLHSLDPHPLLSEDLLRIKAPIQRENLINTGATNGNPDEQGADVVDSFGSLSISESGRTNYFGQATSSWVSFPRDRSVHAVLTIASSLQYYLTVRGNYATSLLCILTISFYRTRITKMTCATIVSVNWPSFYRLKFSLSVAFSPSPPVCL